MTALQHGLAACWSTPIVSPRRDVLGAFALLEHAYPCDDQKGVPQVGGAAARGVCLTVEDTGAGMGEETRTRAVEPFFTTKGEAGTGLGLSQVYGFMQQLGGNLTIESVPGRGTAIHLFFPVARSVS